MCKIDRYDINYYTHGGDAQIEESDDGIWVQFDDIEELIKRDIPMELKGELACPKCNSGNTTNDWDDINNFCGNCGQRLKERQPTVKEKVMVYEFPNDNYHITIKDIEIGDEFRFKEEYYADCGTGTIIKINNMRNARIPSESHEIIFGVADKIGLGSYFIFDNPERCPNMISTIMRWV